MDAYKKAWPHPKMMILNFPNNPTGACTDLDFLTRIVAFARERDIILIHDFAYAEIAFEGYQPPSILQVPEAREIAVEFYSLSKTYNMPGWRVGFCVGNKRIIAALARLKSYLDYGMFTPIQVAATVALNGPQDCVKEIRTRYQRRRDVLCDGLERAGWHVEKPKATMFVWARIPEAFRAMKSLEFSKFLLKEARVAVSPGIGFGEFGDEYVRFGLVENEHRTRQAVRGLKHAFSLGG
jgi:alanine-synthesizing transaminase